MRPYLQRANRRYFYNAPPSEAEREQAEERRRALMRRADITLGQMRKLIEGAERGKRTMHALEVYQYDYLNRRLTKQLSELEKDREAENHR